MVGEPAACFFRFSLAVALLALFPLAGCGGGGSAGSGLPTPDPLGSAQPPGNFVDSEFDRNYGLGMIEAQEAYGLGASGSGVVVAVIDSGIDTEHLDLDDNISPQSTDIVEDHAELADEMGHGTIVSGIIAAERNGFVLHGVAYDATILAIRADARDEDGNSLGYFNISDIASALDYAAGKAHVINMSLGSHGTTIDDSFGETFEQALIDAMAAEAIIVVSAGNDAALEPSLPAAYAGDETINESGQMIAVASSDTGGTALASFSNQCGSAMEFCLTAPGEDIWSTYPGDYVNYPDYYWYARTDGTSLAAPHVSGAAALLIQLWPALEPAEVVQILLTSATDLGDEGVDPVFGHGLLNIENAVAPAGTLSIPLAGGSASLNGTTLSLGPAFGDALTGNSLLGRSFALDAYGRDYGVDLRNRVNSAKHGFGLFSLIEDGHLQSVGVILPGELALSMDLAETDRLPRPLSPATESRNSEIPELRTLSLQGELSGTTGFRFGYNLPAEQQLPGAGGSAARSLFWMPDSLMTPHYSLIGAGNGVALSQGLGSGTEVSLGWIDNTGHSDENAGRARIGEVTLAHRLDGGGRLSASYARLGEDGRFLGATATGGFAVEGARSQFVSIGGHAPLGGRLQFVGSYTMGEAEIAADGTNLLSEWSTARAEAFGVGLVRRGVFGSSDRIGLMAGQPLRVSAASALLTVPDGYGADKSLTHASERVALTPSGREFDLQLAYERPAGSSARISTWLMMQLEPGHVADADPAYGVGLRFGLEF